MRALNLWLLCLAILAVMVWVIPEPESDCWLPANAPTRGIYEDCYSFWQIWTAPPLVLSRGEETG
jgi:hypothetical protein